MRAIKIDPYDQSVTEIDLDDADVWKDMRRIIKEKQPQCRGFDFVYSIKGHFLVVDDEGLIQTPTPPLFCHASYQQPLAGMAFVVGNKPPEGDFCSATIKTHKVREDTLFPGKRLRYEGMEQFETMSKHPLFGDEPVHTFGSVPLFSVDSEEPEKK